MLPLVFWKYFSQILTYTLEIFPKRQPVKFSTRMALPTSNYGIISNQHFNAPKAILQPIKSSIS